MNIIRISLIYCHQMGINNRVVFLSVQLKGCCIVLEPSG